MCPLRCASLLEPICTTARKFLRDGAARGNLRTRLCLDHASPHRPVGKSNKLSSMAHALAAVQWHIRIRLRQYRRFQGHQSLRWRVLATTPQKVSLVTDDAGWSSTRCLRARPPLRRRRLLCVPATHVALRAAERHRRFLRQQHAGLSRSTRGPALLRRMLCAPSYARHPLKFADSLDRGRIAGDFTGVLSRRRVCLHLDWIHSEAADANGLGCSRELLRGQRHEFAASILDRQIL